MSQLAKAWLALGCAFATWGLFPIFVRMMSQMRADEFLYVRIVFSFLGLLVLFYGQGRLGKVLSHVLRPSFLLRTTLTALLIAANWLMYILAVNWQMTMQASMGYFITPLINVLFGVWLFQEKLDRWQITAVALALAGVIYQMLALGIMPWLPLAIGGAFGFYGVLRKKFAIPPLQGLFAEMLVLLPLALVAWAGLGLSGEAFDYLAQPSMIVMVVLAGVITLAPLLLFLYAIEFLPLTGVGLAQYSTPTIQFLIALWLFHEPFDIHRLIAFALIWIGLGIYSIHLLQLSWRKKT